MPYISLIRQIMADINLADQRNYGVYLADLQNIAADQTNYALYLADLQNTAADQTNYALYLAKYCS